MSSNTSRQQLRAQLRARQTRTPTGIKSPHLIKNALCIAWDDCKGARMVLGAMTIWPDGRGHNQKLYCTRCPATGEQSVNYESGGKRHKR